MPTPCAVTGNLISLLGTTAGYGTANFQLVNTGIGTIPRVIGTGMFPLLSQTAQADQNGNISTNLWGNDNIDPANTLYLVTLRDQNQNQIVQTLFDITGASFNLNTATAANTILPPVMVQVGNLNRILPILGSPVVSGDFLLTGWGAGVTITGIVGTDTMNQFTVTAGTAPSVSPTVQLTYHDGTWGNVPIVFCLQVAGTGSRTDLAIASTATTTTLTYLGLPVATQTYTFVLLSAGHP